MYDQSSKYNRKTETRILNILDERRKPVRDIKTVCLHQHDQRRIPLAWHNASLKGVDKTWRDGYEQRKRENFSAPWRRDVMWQSISIKDARLHQSSYKVQLNYIIKKFAIHPSDGISSSIKLSFTFDNFVKTVTSLWTAKRPSYS